MKFPHSSQEPAVQEATMQEMSKEGSMNVNFRIFGKFAIRYSLLAKLAQFSKFCKLNLQPGP
jgi:hypothetical protein